MGLAAAGWSCWCACSILHRGVQRERCAIDGHQTSAPVESALPVEAQAARCATPWRRVASCRSQCAGTTNDAGRVLRRHSMVWTAVCRRTKRPIILKAYMKVRMRAAAAAAAARDQQQQRAPPAPLAEGEAGARQQPEQQALRCQPSPALRQRQSSEQPGRQGPPRHQQAAFAAAPRRPR